LKGEAKKDQPKQPDKKEITIRAKVGAGTEQIHSTHEALNDFALPLMMY